MHIWGVVRLSDVLQLGCRALRSWAAAVGAWSGGPGPWAVELFSPGDARAIKHLTRLVATITKMYRWKRYGGAQAPRADGAGTHLTFSAASFKFAWDDELGGTND